MTLRYGMVLIGVLALAGCDDNGGTDAGGGGTDAGGGGTDSGMMDTDAGGGGTDAGMMGSDAGGGMTDAGDVDAGGGGGAECSATDLIIEEVDPNTGITLFNPTAAPIDTSSGYLFCQRPHYPTLSSLEGGVTIPAGGRHTFAWPSSFPDTDAGGEVALYTSTSFTDPTALIDFVCWGTGHASGRKSVAEADGDWSGDCAGAITGDSIRRVPGTDGHGAASYDPTGAAAELSCP